MSYYPQYQPQCPSNTGTIILIISIIVLIGVIIVIKYKPSIIKYFSSITPVSSAQLVGTYRQGTNTSPVITITASTTSGSYNVSTGQGGLSFTAPLVNNTLSYTFSSTTPGPGPDCGSIGFTYSEIPDKDSIGIPLGILTETQFNCDGTQNYTAIPNPVYVKNYEPIVCPVCPVCPSTPTPAVNVTPG